MDKAQQTIIQAKAVRFAFSELVLQQRNSFKPLWTLDSWAKFLIWIALNCGLSGEQESLELFAESLGAPLTRQMRKLFFERTLQNLSCHLIADPAEAHVLLMPTTTDQLMDSPSIGDALEEVGLSPMIVLDKSKWQNYDGVVAIPWKSLENQN